MRYMIGTGPSGENQYRICEVMGPSRSRLIALVSIAC